MIIYDYNPRAAKQAKKQQRQKLKRPPLPNTTFLLVLFGLFLATALVAFLYPRWQQQASNDTATSQGLPANMQMLAPPGVYLTVDDKSARLPVKFSMVAPTQWQAQRVSQDKGKLQDPLDYLVVGYNFHAAPLGKPVSQANSTLRIENVSIWLSNGDTAAKQAYIDWLIGLRSTRTVSSEEVSKYRAVSHATGEYRNLQFIHSADSKLSGFTYVSSDGSILQTRMAGVVNGQTVYQTGQYKLAGSSDAVQNQAIAMTQSIVIDVSTRVKAAPAVNQ